MKQQVDIDKENGELVEIEIKQLKEQIERDRKMQQEYQGIYDARQSQISDFKKQMPRGDNTLTAENLAKLGVSGNFGQDRDAMTEFSVLTTETDILPTENFLDLRVAEV